MVVFAVFIIQCFALIEMVLFVLSRIEVVFDSVDCLWAKDREDVN